MVQESLMLRTESRGRLQARAHARWEFGKYSWYERMLTRRADLLVFQSEYDKNDFSGRNRLAASRAAVVYGNIGSPRFKEEHEGANKSEKVRRVVFIGNYDARKGARYLVEAVEILARRGLKSVHFELIGPGEGRIGFERLVRELGLNEMITLRGHVLDPFPYLLEADLMVIPSLFDSFPDTVLEALHVGIPVIASRVGGIPEILVHDELLFPPADSVAIADQIEKCVKDSEFYSKLRRLCDERRRVFHFDWPAAWEKLICQTIRAHASRRDE